MNNKNDFLLILLVLMFSCKNLNNSNSIQIPPDVANEFSKYGIQPTGPFMEYYFTLPDSLNDAEWSVKDFACTQGGYHLEKYTGKRLRFLKYPSNEHWGNDPLDIWAITDSPNCVCIYKAVQSESTSAPGVFSVNDTTIKK